MWTAIVICFLAVFVFRFAACLLALAAGALVAAERDVLAGLSFTAAITLGLASVLSALATLVMLVWKLLVWINET